MLSHHPSAAAGHVISGRIRGRVVGLVTVKGGSSPVHVRSATQRALLDHTIFFIAEFGILRARPLLSPNTHLAPRCW